MQVSSVRRTKNEDNLLLFQNFSRYELFILLIIRIRLDARYYPVPISIDPSYPPQKVRNG